MGLLFLKQKIQSCFSLLTVFYSKQETFDFEHYFQSTSVMSLLIY